MRDNRGFTLIELIVSMVIGLFVALGVTLLISVSLSQFRDSRSETSSQMESQNFTSRVSNLLMSSSDFNTFEDSDKLILEISSTVADSATSPRNTVNKVFYVILDKSSHKAYLKCEDSRISSPLLAITYDNTNFFTSNVETFGVSPSSFAGLTNKRSLILSITTSVGNISFSDELILSVRNN